MNRNAGEGGHLVAARFHTRCGVCGCGIKPGDHIVHFPAKSMSVCASCHDARRTPPPTKAPATSSQGSLFGGHLA